MFAVGLIISGGAMLFVSGILYGFSDFIMRALNQLGPSHATEAMQRINGTVYRSLFMVLLMVLTLIAILAMIWSLVTYGWASESRFVLAGSVAYVVMFGVTGRGNVPLNQSLARTSSTAKNIASVWENYYRSWTRFNTLRSIAGVIAGFCWIIAGITLLP